LTTGRAEQRKKIKMKPLKTTMMGTNGQRKN